MHFATCSSNPHSPHRLRPSRRRAVQYRLDLAIALAKLEFHPESDCFLVHGFQGVGRLSVAGQLVVVAYPTIHRSVEFGRKLLDGCRPIDGRNLTFPSGVV